ncbi:MAG: DUF2064 domain-containing protein [Pseudomonadota bacterium]
MAKRPIAGHAKRRLAGDVGVAEAIRVYRTLLHGMCRRLGHDPRWRTVLAVTPDYAVGDQHWPRGIAREAQGRGDLGARMGQAIMRQPTGPCVLIGSDVPRVAPDMIWRAFQALGDHDVVFGPAPDGGYWLVGARRTPRMPPLFSKPVRWSTEHALADTCAGLPDHRIGLVEERADLDTGADYLRWRKAA